MSALLDELKETIALEGPITVERYMALCLSHPVHGYYRTRDPLGAAGDFTTSPEISQMFGELLGLWAIEVWATMGAPASLRLAELGPGRGTLMADLLRAAQIRPAFADALDLHLVETSPVLRARQEEQLGNVPAPVAWHQRFEEIPRGPAIVIANEFFDALPIRQFERAERGWRERLVDLAPDGSLAFGLADRCEAQMNTASGIGDVLEWPAAAIEATREIVKRLVEGGGAALIIDYGYEGPAFGDTLQAVSQHRFVDPLESPGEADLTAHVDFRRLAMLAREHGAAVLGPVTQGAFLRSLGIEARAGRLKQVASAAQATEIDAALERLIGTGPEGMGGLFKVMALADPTLTALPGFPRAS